MYLFVCRVRVHTRLYSLHATGALSQLLKVFTYLSIYYTQELKYLLYVKLSKESEGIT